MSGSEPASEVGLSGGGDPVVGLAGSEPASEVGLSGGGDGLGGGQG